MLPVEKSRALRQLVPYCTGTLVLVAHDERELIACSGVRALAEEGVDGNEAVIGEEPCVLRPARAARWTVASRDAATELRITDPGLLERHLRPVQGAVHRRIGRLDVDDVQPCITTSRTSLVVPRLHRELRRDLEWRFVRRARTGKGDRRAARLSGRRADSKTDASLEFRITSTVLYLLMGDDLPRYDRASKSPRGLIERVRRVCRVPVDFLAADGSWPHEVERRREVHGDENR